MLYEELQKLTGAGDRCKYPQFEHVNAIYMESRTMTKEQAADLWRTLYVKSRKPRERQIKPGSAEIQRSGVTPAQFMAACRAALRKAGLDGWIGTISKELMETSGDGETWYTYAKERPEGRFIDSCTRYDPDALHEEIYRHKAGNVQYYCKNMQDGSRYNFIYEFTYDDERIR